jgi:hypothetical protein
MDEDEDQFLNQVLSGIAEAEIATIFFPLLRRALVVDTRHTQDVAPLVRLMPQVGSMEERIASIENARPQLGKVRSILGVPWLKSVNSLIEHGIADQLVKRLSDAGLPGRSAQSLIDAALRDLARIERKAFEAMIRGEGYQTLWSARG